MINGAGSQVPPIVLQSSLTMCMTLKEEPKLFYISNKMLLNFPKKTLLEN